MSAQFVIPDWFPRAQPEPLPPVDDHRIEGLVNRFIAGKQEALFTAPDAFYRLESRDAIDGQPVIAQRLQDLRAATLDLAGDDGERAALGPRLDLHIDDAMDGIGRHVATQRQAWHRQIISERQTLLQRAAQYEHDNDDKILGLAHANASAAQELARMEGFAPDSPEEAAILGAARSQILRTALAERIRDSKDAQALALYERVKNQLSAADRRALEVPMQVAATNTATDAWLQREAGTPGVPLADRVAADPALTQDQRTALIMKIAARESAQESNRVAMVRGLDDQRDAATHTLATQPNDYRIGTFAKLAGAYDDAGEAAKAEEMRRAAQREPMLRAFSSSSPERRQALIDLLPKEDRAMAQAIHRYQSGALNRDLYVPKTANRPVWTDGASPRALDTTHPNGLLRVDATPDEFRSLGDAPRKEPLRSGSGTAEVEPPSGSEVRHASDRRVRDMQEVEAIDTDRMITDWMARASQPDYQPRNIPPFLEKRLSPEQKEAIDRIMSAKPHKLMGHTDPSVYADIWNGLTSSDRDERIRWARTPLYQYRLSISPGDFATLTTLQKTISPHTGYPTTGEVGHPIGPLDDHAKIALALAPILRLPAWIIPILQSATGVRGDSVVKAMIKRRRPQQPRFPRPGEASSPPTVEPAPGSREYQAAEDELRQLQNDDRDEPNGGTSP